jgi:hypothetical protein
MARGDFFKGKTTEEIKAIRAKRNVNEFGGFKVNDPVKLNIPGIDPKHTGTIDHIKFDKQIGEHVFFVRVVSIYSCKDGEMWMAFLDELEKLK